MKRVSQWLTLFIFWCLGPDLNRHGGGPPRDFKSLASTNSATQAFLVRSLVVFSLVVLTL